MQSRNDQQPKIQWPLLVTRIQEAVFITFIVMGWFAFEGYFQWVPVHPEKQTVAPWLILIGPLWYLLLKRCQKLGSRDPELAQAARFLLRFGDRLKESGIRTIGRLPRLAVVGVLAVLAVWIPEFLIQPIWTDHEHVLVMARLWDRGYFPWTSMLTYQFPGEMEFAWLSARLFGWGNPLGYFLLDLLLVLSLMAALAGWSSRRLGTWRFSIFGIIGVLLIEISLPFTNVAQRDAHAVILAMLAFCLPGAMRSIRSGAVLSGLAFGFGLAIRPHMVLFLPMICVGLLWAWLSENTIEPAPNKLNQRRVPVKLLLIWLLAASLSALFFLSPILGPKHLPAFLEALQFPFKQDGAYLNKTVKDVTDVFREIYKVPRHFWYFTFCILMILRPGSVRWRYFGLMLSGIGLSGLIYRAVHPVDHGYLKLPLQFLECLGLMVIPAWLADQAKTINGWTWLSLCGLFVYIGYIHPPYYVEISYTPKAYRYLMTGSSPAYSPPGARAAYPRERQTYHYDWSDWVQATTWLRLETKPDTKLMNLLTYQPFPPFCGTIDRLPLGPTESIILMNWFTKRDFEKDWISALENAEPGSIVAWDHGRTNQVNAGRLNKVIATVEKHYQPRAKFGEIEFWEKIPVQ